ncbi:MAG TPA: 2-oxo-4-hydroxy-4-carboxy-5-ureidoimidazoline decarboxylase [Chloroflexia bacterium]|nr:2-oxo-4-hydroxy-4-carboxy-5-ureidoimidazoline decarboxylase [Chloroflexia bacterium]
MSKVEGELTLDGVNALDPQTFIDRLGGVFEHSPWVAEGAWQQRPFANVESLHEAMCGVVDRSPREMKEALIMAHPDLVGRAAENGSLTPTSAKEQASAGLDRLSAEEIALFRAYNRLYKEKFGFPFVICVRENRKEAILAGFNSRLENSRDQEIETALREIAKITRLRLEDLFSAVRGDEHSRIAE